MAVFVAWMLDQCATTDEVSALLQKAPFAIQGATFDGGTVSQLHWGVTDKSGKSIIFEFDHGKIHIYDMGDYRAMTNDPNWPQMTAIINYWDKIGGKNMLPGTVSSPDRCVRANYFAHHVKAVDDPDLAVAICRSILVLYIRDTGTTGAQLNTMAHIQRALQPALLFRPRNQSRLLLRRPQ